MSATGNGRRVYADNNASTAIDPVVKSELCAALDDVYANPSGLHAEGRAAFERLEAARATIARLIDPERADPDTIVFTSGGTESNNLALRNVALGSPPGSVAITSAFEHHSVLDAFTGTSVRVVVVPITRSGYVDMRALEGALRDNAGRVRVVTVMLAQNEIGTVQPIRDIVALARRLSKNPRPVVHVDATQAIGKVPFTIESLGRPELLTGSAHKFHGPRGVGFLYAARGVLSPDRALMFGGGQERRLRSGTENVAGALAMAVALERAVGADASGQSRVVAHVRAIGALRDELARRIRDAVPDAVFNGGAGDLGPALPNTLNVTVPGVASFARRLDELGVTASSGSACARGVPSHVLSAIGCGDSASATARISLSRFTTRDDVAAIARAIATAASERASRPRGFVDAAIADPTIADAPAASLESRPVGQLAAAAPAWSGAPWTTDDREDFVDAWRGERAVESADGSYDLWWAARPPAAWPNNAEAAARRDAWNGDRAMRSVAGLNV